MASRLLVDVAVREETKGSDGVWLSGLFLGQRETCIELPGARLNDPKEFARHEELGCECWAQLLEVHFEHHEGPSARWDLLGGFRETCAMQTFKLELLGWFSELCSAAYGTGDKGYDKKWIVMVVWLMNPCPVLTLKLKDHCPHHSWGQLLFAFNLSVSQAFLRLSKQSCA